MNFTAFTFVRLVYSNVYLVLYSNLHLMHNLLLVFIGTALT